MVSRSITGMKNYPKYGQYIPVDYMKAFYRDFLYLWADTKYWDFDKSVLPFDVIMPFLEKYKALRKKVLRVMHLMLDESMSGWRPKTS